MEYDMFITDEERIILDLHERAIETAEYKIKEIVVVHGYRKGQAILNMVRKDFKHNRIEKKVVPFNKGITLIYLKKA